MQWTPAVQDQYTPPQTPPIGANFSGFERTHSNASLSSLKRRIADDDWNDSDADSFVKKRTKMEVLYNNNVCGLESRLVSLAPASAIDIGISVNCPMW